MAKNHTFLGLLCAVALCLHLHFACHSLKPDAVPVPGAEQREKSETTTENESNSHLSYAKSSSTRPKLTPKQLQVQKIYTGQIGVKEKGHNAGKQVEAYLSYVGLGKGHAWCAAFICWVYGKADVPNPKTPWTPSLFPASKTIWKRDENTMSKIESPKTGDIFGLYFPEKKRIAHAGFIDQWDENWIITVEGNTNADGHRDGDGVYRKRRLTKSIYCVARYIPSRYP